MDEPHWTPKLVQAYLEEAADTLRRLPNRHIQGYVSTWPDVVQDYWEAFGWSETEARLSPPSPRAIDQMDRTLTWLQWLEPSDSKLVWERASGRPWKVIAHDRGIDRTTAWRHWTYALITIAAKLNVLNVATTMQQQTVQH